MVTSLNIWNLYLSAHNLISTILNQNCPEKQDCEAINQTVDTKFVSPLKSDDDTTNELGDWSQSASNQFQWKYFNFELSFKNRVQIPNQIQFQFKRILSPKFQFRSFFKAPQIQLRSPISNSKFQFNVVIFQSPGPNPDLGPNLNFKHISKPRLNIRCKNKTPRHVFIQII